MIRINSVFWKIFLLIYVANIAIVVGATGLTIYWAESEWIHKKQQSFVNKVVKLVTQEYEKGEEVNTEAYFLKKIARNNTNRKRLLEQTIRIVALENDELIFHNRLSVASLHDMERKIAITSRSDKKYQVFTSLAAAPKGPPPKIVLEKFKSFTLIQIIFICFISALASYIISWGIVTPLKRLGLYSQRYQETQERVNIEQSLLKRGDEIGDLSRGIQALHQSIDEKISKQKALLHDVSHELRAPLARLQATAGLIQQNHDDSHIQRVHKECDEINALIQSILNYSRIDQVPLQLDDVDLLAILEAEIEAVKYQFSGRTISIKNIDNLPLVKIEPEFFIHAFGNILRNACIHTNADSPIYIIGETKGSQVFISVLDQGPGIPEAELEQVLNPFYRQGQKMHSDGHGLGLSIAKRAMERMGGGITLQNHKNGGLLVTLYV